MTPKEAIGNLEYLISEDCTDSQFDFVDEVKFAIEALKKVEDYKAQWIDDVNNPLEPLKLSSALDSEIFKMRYRMENKPKEINILDYTVIAALQDCLKRYSKGSEDK